MDAFLVALHDLCEQLLPILGATILVVLIIFLIKLIKTLNITNSVIDRSKITIDLVDQSIEKIQSPLDTAVKISHTVDNVHDKGVQVAADVKDFAEKNIDVLKEKISKMTADKKEDVEKEPSPEDIIGG